MESDNKGTGSCCASKNMQTLQDLIGGAVVKPGISFC